MTVKKKYGLDLNQLNQPYSSYQSSTKIQKFTKLKIKCQNDAS